MAQIYVELGNGNQFTLSYDATDAKSRARTFKCLHNIFGDLWLTETEEAKKYRRSLYRKLGRWLYRFMTNSIIIRVLRRLEEIIF
jgi:hypothetical protein